MGKAASISIDQVGNGYVVTIKGANAKRREAQGFKYALLGGGDEDLDGGETQMVFHDPVEMGGWIAVFLTSQMPEYQAQFVEAKAQEAAQAGDHASDAAHYWGGITLMEAAARRARLIRGE